MIHIRSYRSDDAPALLSLFRDTIRRVNSRDYDEAQIRAWAPDDIDPLRWAARFEGRFVVVADESGVPIGFGELEADGHIDRFYVSADHQRQGVGRALIGAILAEADRRGLNELFVEASITAKPFFEAHGFSVIAAQAVSCRGADLVNFRMSRPA